MTTTTTTTTTAPAQGLARYQHVAPDIAARARAWRDADADRQLARGDALRALDWAMAAAAPGVPTATFDRRYALALAAMARWDQTTIIARQLRTLAVVA
jgi:hypothetical protein